jgi:SAM-dependent methyltransferase
LLKRISGKIYRILQNWVYPFLPLDRLVSAPGQYWRFWRSYFAYRNLPQAEPLAIRQMRPMLYDRTSTTGYDKHYFYQGVWLFEHVQKTQPSIHIDVGSLVQYSGFLSKVAPVVFLDIRPAVVDLPNFKSMNTDILRLPFASGSVSSLSCLHVAEHIGLGRYGDSLDPQGTQKAARELVRILAPGGHLYFSLPIGLPRVQFNAHRIHSPQQILDYFTELALVEFAVVDDSGRFFFDVDPQGYKQSGYACGMFHFMNSD